MRRTWSPTCSRISRADGSSRAVAPLRRRSAGDDGVSRIDSRASQADDRGDERAAARDGDHRERRLSAITDGRRSWSKVCATSISGFCADDRREQPCVTHPDDVIVTLMGPTASGKTELAMRLADAMPVEIISVDSAMVYREMNIGTAKPTAAVLERYPHQLIDLKDPRGVVFGRRVRRRCARVCRGGARGGPAAAARRRHDAVLQGVQRRHGRSAGDVERGPRRARASVPNAKVWPRCTRNCSASIRWRPRGIHPNNPQRLLRALEVYATSGRPISEFWAPAVERRRRASAGLSAARVCDRAAARRGECAHRTTLRRDAERRLARRSARVDGAWRSVAGKAVDARGRISAGVATSQRRDRPRDDDRARGCGNPSAGEATTHVAAQLVRENRAERRSRGGPNLAIYTG